MRSASRARVRGLLEFAHANNGAMVKRLHMGRAAEGGVLAASLAAEGFTGPTSVLEGGGGFLQAFCNDFDVAELTHGLGTDYFTLDIMLKRYACHITAHNPVEAVVELRKQYNFTAADVVAINIAGNDRMAKTNNIPAPRRHDAGAIHHPVQRRAVALSRSRRSALVRRGGGARPPHSGHLVAGEDADRPRPGSPQPRGDGHHQAQGRQRVVAPGDELQGHAGTPAGRAELKEKFMLLTKRLGRDKAVPLFDRLQDIENEKSLDWLNV